MVVLLPSANGSVNKYIPYTAHLVPRRRLTQQSSEGEPKWLLDTSDPLIIWWWNLRICSSGCRGPQGRTCAQTGSRVASCHSTCTVSSALYAARWQRWRIRSSRKQGTPHEFKVDHDFGMGQAKDQITLTFALLLTWTLSSMDCNHLQNY